MQTELAMMPSEWVPSPDSSYASSASGTGTGSLPRCEISLLERLIRTHPLWFLPSLQRSGALHLLQGREVGNFIVRSSREPDTMAVSVKLPGNQVEHYLLKANEENRIALQDSSHSFPTVHQLVAHYCENSDEIPVCLRVPIAIAEAITRQQLRSLALLGQEFWTISSPSPSSSSCPLIIKEQGSSPPSDADSSQSHLLQSKSSGIGSQSSSSQNSLSDLGKKPCRPTTLELGKSRTLLQSCASGITPQSVPVTNHTNSNIRWHLTTPTMSQPSSVQSTPSELQSSISVSDKMGERSRRKKTSGGKSIHYKDTEIIDLFKGTTTLLDDKISDYEDVWSHSQTNPNTPNTPTAPTLPTSRRLFTFKPDVIPNTTTPTPDLDYYSNNNYPSHRPANQSKSLSLSVTPTTEDVRHSVIPARTFINNRHRFSLKNINMNYINNINNTEGGMKRVDKGVYSEPVDAINFIRNKIESSKVAHNNRWSQPASVLKSESNRGTRMKRQYCKSSDNLNRLREVSDENISLAHQSNQNFGSRTLRTGIGNPSCWQLDNSWQFCSSSNQKEKTEESPAQRNKHNLKLSCLSSTTEMEKEDDQPLSPSPENWNHLLNIVKESSLQLESIQIVDNNENSFTKSQGHQKYLCEEGNDSIRKIVKELSHKSTGVFGPTLKSFISCTLSAKVQDPFKVLRNIRQFISGMKNYLVGVNGESEAIHQEIKKQTEQLKSSEFLNIDLILEDILVDLVIQPLYHHVMNMLDKANNNGHYFPSPSSHNEEQLVKIYESFERTVSPIHKLHFWNQLISQVQDSRLFPMSPSNIFIKQLTLTLSNICTTNNLESHADFITALLPPAISESNSYSLSLLQSVASELKLCSRKEVQQGHEVNPMHWDKKKWNSSQLTSIKVIVPDERNGTLITKVVPFKESMTIKDVSKTLSSKLGITNVSDYVLVTVQDGEEHICPENELIQKCIGFGTNPVMALAYKRLDAKIGWPLKIA